MKLKSTIFCLAPPCAGKSYTANENENVKDIDNVWWDCATQSEFNKSIDSCLNKRKNLILSPYIFYSFIFFKGKWKPENDISLVIARPTLSQEGLEDFIKRELKRYDSYIKEVGYMEKDKYIELCAKAFFANIKAAENFNAIDHQKLILKPYQYLNQALAENGVELIQKTIERI